LLGGLASTACMVTTNGSGSGASAPAQDESTDAKGTERRATPPSAAHDADSTDPRRRSARPVAASGQASARGSVQLRARHQFSSRATLSKPLAAEVGAAARPVRFEGLRGHGSAHGSANVNVNVNVNVNAVATGKGSAATTSKPPSTKPATTKPTEQPKPPVTKPATTKPTEQPKPPVTKPATTKPTEQPKPPVTKPTEQPKPEPPTGPSPQQLEQPIEPPDSPPENVFGYDKPIKGCFEGQVYFLPEQTQKLPSSYESMQPQSVVYACEWDVPPRDWQQGFPGLADRVEWFAIRYHGAFSVQTAGSYLFRSSSDDGSRLTIDGKVVLDNDGVHPPEGKSATVELAAGDHEMVLEYFQGPRYFINLQLWVTAPGGTEGLFSVR
jgi:hypothetical protein